MKYKTSINILLGLLVAVITFHLLVIAKKIPYDIAWGGRLKSDTEMYVFEAVSIVINLFLGLVLLMKGGYTKLRFKEKTINIILWIFLVLFVLNTVGNLFAKTKFEKSLSFLTFISGILIWTILKTSRIIEPKETTKMN